MSDLVNVLNKQYATLDNLKDKMRVLLDTDDRNLVELYKISEDIAHHLLRMDTTLKIIKGKL